MNELHLFHSAINSLGFRNRLILSLLNHLTGMLDGVNKIHHMLAKIFHLATGRLYLSELLRAVSGHIYHGIGYGVGNLSGLAGTGIQLSG